MLRSGVKLNYRSSADEPQRACLRLTVPGGRAAEDPRVVGATDRTVRGHREASGEGEKRRSIAGDKSSGLGSDGDSGGASGDDDNGDGSDSDIGSGGDNGGDSGGDSAWGAARGAVALGARTMQEGGALGGLSRTQVELFCVDQVRRRCLWMQERKAHWRRSHIWWMYSFCFTPFSFN